MRVVFMGTPDFAVPTLAALIENHEVVGVVTQPDKRKGRGKAYAFSPVKEKALEYDIPVYQPVKVREEDFVDTLRALAPDVIVVAAFGQILPESILNLPPYGCINVHASLLPKYRGAAPIQWSIIDGEKETGVTIMYMEKGLDTGDMIARTVVPISPKETGETLHDKLAAAGAPLLLQALSAIADGTAKRIPQGDGESCYAKMLTKELGQIDWSQSAAAIERLIRGLNSWPSAYTACQGKTLKIWDADVTEDFPRQEVMAQDTENAGVAVSGASGAPEDVDAAAGEKNLTPGTVVRVDGSSIYVKTGDGLLKINEVQLQGKKRMAVKVFLLGHKLAVGTVLGCGE